MTAGPYFWADQKTVRARYEALSDHFDGFILSFVSRREWQQASIGSFELIGRFISRGTFGTLPFRTLIRIAFVLIEGLRLHFFKRRIDIIIAYEPLLTGPLAWILSQLTGARFVVEVNNDFQNLANWNTRSLNLLTYLKLRYLELVVPFILNRANAVRLLYPGQVSGFRRLKPRDTYYCFHDFVATSLFAPGQPRAERRILFLGHPWYLKGVDLLLRAFNEVSPDYPDWVLGVVGHLPEKEEYLHLYAGNPKVEFSAPVMPDDVIPLMQACSLFILPSRSEGMPRVLIEAMASGKPVIASKVGGIPYYIRHRETGLLFESEDLKGLSASLRGILSDPALAQRLGEHGRAFVAERLSDTCYVAAFRAMLDDVSGAQSRRL